MNVTIKKTTLDDLANDAHIAADMAALSRHPIRQAHPHVLLADAIKRAAYADGYYSAMQAIMSRPAPIPHAYISDDGFVCTHAIGGCDLPIFLNNAGDAERFLKIMDNAFQRKDGSPVDANLVRRLRGLLTEYVAKVEDLERRLYSTMVQTHAPAAAEALTRSGQ